MMSKQKPVRPKSPSLSGLGRGLESLLGEYVPEHQKTENEAGIGNGTELPMNAIFANKSQPRQTMPDTELNELAQSIRMRGVLQAILVRPDGLGRYQIVAGERRWRAAQMAGLKTIPVLIRELDDMAVAEIGIIENVQREDLNPLDEAESYRQLIDRFGHTQEALAGRIGKSRPHIANMLRLLKLPGPVQEMVRKGQLGAGHARAILTAKDPEQLARQIVSEGFSVREAENLARRDKDKPAKRKTTEPLLASSKDDIRGLEHSLREITGLDLHISNRGEHGEVKIRYAGMEELDDICRRLSGGE